MNVSKECEECGGFVKMMKWDRDEEGWIWCRDCGLVDNDGSRKRLEELRVEEWVEMLKKVKIGMLKRDLRKFGMVENGKDRMKIIKKIRNDSELGINHNYERDN